MGNQANDLPRLAPRKAESHKGDFGRALVIGGSRGMSGAIALAGMGCLRSGAGLVTLALPENCLETVAALNPCYMTCPLPADSNGRFAPEAAAPLVELVQPATATAIGPGLGRGGGVTQLVRTLYESAKVPMVVDADALNALAEHALGLKSAGGPRILTPHPGEFDRLFGERAGSKEQRERRATELAGQHGVVMVLKGHGTLVTDGRRMWRNRSGNPGMATGGSGDVLTGIITALVCQQLTPFDAARLGVYVHGLAGDLAAEALSPVAMTAADVVRFLPAAWKQQDES